MSRDDIVFHLTEHHGDAYPGAKVFIEYSGNLPGLHKELISKVYKYNKPGLEATPRGELHMEVTGPSETGYYSAPPDKFPRLFYNLQTIS